MPIGNGLPSPSSVPWMLISERHAAYARVLGVLAQRRDVAREPVPHEEPRSTRSAAAHSSSGERTASAQASRRRGRRGSARRAGRRTAPAGTQQVGDEVVGQVRAVADPGQHADLVVELHGDDVAAARLEAFGDERARPRRTSGAPRRGTPARGSRRCASGPGARPSRPGRSRGCSV